MTDARERRAAIRRDVETRARELAEGLTERILGIPANPVDTIYDLLKDYVGVWFEDWIEEQLPRTLRPERLVRIYVRGYLAGLAEFRRCLLAGQDDAEPRKEE